MRLINNNRLYNAAVLTESTASTTESIIDCNTPTTCDSYQSPSQMLALYNSVPSMFFIELLSWVNFLSYIIFLFCADTMSSSLEFLACMYSLCDHSVCKSGRSRRVLNNSFCTSVHNSFSFYTSNSFPQSGFTAIVFSPFT